MSDKEASGGESMAGGGRKRKEVSEWLVKEEDLHVNSRGAYRT